MWQSFTRNHPAFLPPSRHLPPPIPQHTHTPLQWSLYLSLGEMYRTCHREEITWYVERDPSIWTAREHLADHNVNSYQGRYIKMYTLKNIHILDRFQFSFTFIAKRTRVCFFAHSFHTNIQMDRVKRIWYLSPMRAAKVQAARSYKLWVKRNLQTESQIPGPSEWFGMRS